MLVCLLGEGVDGHSAAARAGRGEAPFLPYDMRLAHFLISGDGGWHRKSFWLFPPGIVAQGGFTGHKT